MNLFLLLTEEESLLSKTDTFEIDKNEILLWELFFFPKNLVFRNRKNELFLFKYSQITTQIKNSFHFPTFVPYIPQVTQIPGNKFSVA